MATLYRIGFILICLSGCSSDVANENAASMIIGSAVRDSSVPSPSPLNTNIGGAMNATDSSDKMVGGAPEAGSVTSGGSWGESAAGEMEQASSGGQVVGGNSDTAPAPGGVEMQSNVTVAECTDLYQCISSCMGSQPCADRCRDLAGEAVANWHDSVFTCGLQNACNDPGGRWNAECMANACRVPLERCFGEPNLPGQRPARVDPPVQPGSCNELGQCLLACPANDQICSDACRDAADEASVQLWNTYQGCLSNAVCGVTDHACRRRNCENEFEACFDRMIVQPVGANSCSLYNQCVAACPDNDAGCEDNCLAATSPDGYNQSVELSLCLSRSNCADDDLDCIERTCLAQIEACFGSLPRGEGTCLELNTCLSNCGDDDAPCRDACVAATSDAEYEKFQVAIECIRMNCPDGGLACERTRCAPEVQACLGDVPIPMGQNNCRTLNSCILDCPDDNQACENVCIETSSPAAFEQFISYNDCLGDAPCADVNYACRRESCVMEGLACFGRYPIPNGNLTCRQLDLCFSNCNDGDQACIDACIDRASAQGFNAHAAFAMCLQGGGLCEAESIACF